MRAWISIREPWPALINAGAVTLPTYSATQLADRSLGHAAGCLALLFELGFTQDSDEVSALTQFFRHYLTARQLNDDLHDWEADLARGHLTFVVAQVLQQWATTGRSLATATDQALEQLREFFWTTVAPQVCQLALDHLQRAQSQLKEARVITNPDGMLAWLQPIERSANQALTEREQAVAFLRTYHNQETP